ncbi:MAG: acyl--CoA ligase [Proteobacteria bacterium]|nr:acyl--CoA ligase [Pseudomonadota bacterium]
MQQYDVIHSFLHQSALSHPEKIALIQKEEKVSYEELAERAEQISQWLLHHDLQPGERVAILTDDACEYVAAYFGILAAGGIAIGLNTQTSNHALSSVLADSGSCIVLSQQKFQKYASVIMAQASVRHFETTIRSLWEHGIRSEPKPLPRIHSEDIAQIIYTSGTTGAPKGVMLSHRNLAANTQSTVGYLGLTERDTIMAVLPFFYSYGNSVLLTHIAAGGTLVVNQSFLYPNVILEQMAAEAVTGFSGVPSSFAILLNRSSVREYSFPKLRYLTQAGAPMSPALAANLSAVFPEVKIFIMYGQTEAGPRLSFLEPERVVDKAGSIGKAIPGVTLTVCRPDGSEVEVGELGEIVATGDNIMAGYWQQPEETATVLKKGKLWTGDLARVDQDGFLFIESRKSDMIKSGSHRIGPKEIEDAIMEFSSIHEVAVVGHKDDILGEKIVAFLVVKEGCDASEKELLRHCRRNLPSFKVPHTIIFENELPKTATGKIQKTELKK